jgi:broad-specificity NMP kinase
MKISKAEKQRSLERKKLTRNLTVQIMRSIGAEALETVVTVVVVELRPTKPSTILAFGNDLISQVYRRP